MIAFGPTGLGWILLAVAVAAGVHFVGRFRNARSYAALTHQCGRAALAGEFAVLRAWAQMDSSERRRVRRLDVLRGTGAALGLVAAATVGVGRVALKLFGIGT